MEKTFKFNLGDIVNHRSQKFGDNFLIVGRYRLEELGVETPQNIYRVRSQHSHCLDMMEEEIIPADKDGFAKYLADHVAVTVEKTLVE